MRFELLEDRRLLAVAVVDTDQDVVDFADGVTSLREAIFAANTIAGPDTIEFAPSLTAGGPATILLTQGELAITDALTINGPSANLLTIDASGSDPTPDEILGDGIRAFRVDGGVESEIEVTFDTLTITGGDLYEGGDVGGEIGGAIESRNAILTVSNCILRDNASASGGAIYLQGSGSVTNSIFANNVGGVGGGMRIVGNVTVSNSVFLANSSDFGGALHIVSGIVWIRDSALIGNSAEFLGGAIRNRGILNVSNTTVSNNSSEEEGGGIHSANQANIYSSTITGNSAGVGGGVMRDPREGGIIRIYHSIVAGNTNSLADPSDIYLAAFLSNSLIGDNTGSVLTEAPLGSPDAFGNLIGGPISGTIDPLLGPLVYNGGPTLPDGSKMLTHALLPGSPAIDAGDPNFNPNDPDGDPETDDAILWDQRGEPFARVVDGDLQESIVVDIGAYESQGVPAFHPADYNQNGIVDGADYTVWRDTVGSTDDFRADGSGPTPGMPDGVIDEWDFLFWRGNFGNTLVVNSGSGAGAAAPVPEPTQQSADAHSLPVPILRSFTVQPYSQPLKSTAPESRIQSDSSAARRDALLAAWLASQSRASAAADISTAPRRDDGSTDPADDVDADSIDRVFDLLGSDVLPSSAY